MFADCVPDPAGTPILTAVSTTPSNHPDHRPSFYLAKPIGGGLQRTDIECSCKQWIGYGAGSTEASSREDAYRAHNEHVARPHAGRGRPTPAPVRQLPVIASATSHRGDSTGAGRRKRRSSWWGAAGVVVVVAILAAIELADRGQVSAKELAEQRWAETEKEALVECERLTALADEGATDGTLRTAHLNRYDEDRRRQSIGAAMASVCPEIRNAVINVASSTPSSPPSATHSSNPGRTRTRTPIVPDTTALTEKADRLALLYGYTLPSSPAGEGAALAELTCERAAQGWDYDTAVEDDIWADAPPDAAIAWNSFVYNDFCPGL